jgi:hypothetical protein
MVIRKGAKKASATPARAIPPGMTEDEVISIEKETMERVSKTISALEGAIATWDASADKPEDLKDKFKRYRAALEALSSWQVKALRSYGKGDIDERVGLLWAFVDLCKTYI